MTRVPPSHRVREAIETLLAEGLTDQGDAASGLFRLGAQPVVQELLEQEVTDRLERGHYQRADATQPHRGYRNGYKQRQVHTAEGTVPVCRPPGTGKSPSRSGVACGRSCGRTVRSSSAWWRRCTRGA